MKNLRDLTITTALYIPLILAVVYRYRGDSSFDGVIHLYGWVEILITVAFFSALSAVQRDDYKPVQAEDRHFMFDICRIARSGFFAVSLAYFNFIFYALAFVATQFLAYAIKSANKRKWEEQHPTKEEEQ